MYHAPQHGRRLSVATACALLLAACDDSTPTAPRPQEATGAAATAQASMTVYASGFDSPRGLKFGPDGILYVAEAGTGGPNSTVGQCQQVPDAGPYKGGNTARISRVVGGTRQTLVDNLPSALDVRGNTLGAADVAFLNGDLYALLTGGGCSHGNLNTTTAVVRVAGGAATQVADLGAFVHANPVAQPNAADFEPDGSFYSMIESGGALYAVEANMGQLVRITPAGAITRVADISASQGHIVPTAVAARDGSFLVGNLSLAPFAPGSAKILDVTPAGATSDAFTGLSAVVGLTFDRAGRLFVLEMTTCLVFQPCFVSSGRVVRINADGSRVRIADGLAGPTGITIGPDGALYVSNFGFGRPAGAGQIVRIDPNNRRPRLSGVLAYERSVISPIIGLDGDLLQFNVRDPNDAGPWSMTIDWGDGSGPKSFTRETLGTLALLHSGAYPGPGTYNVTLTVKDPAGLSDTRTVTLTVP